MNMEAILLFCDEWDNCVYRPLKADNLDFWTTAGMLAYKGLLSNFLTVRMILNNKVYSLTNDKTGGVADTSTFACVFNEVSLYWNEDEMITEF